MDILKKIVFGFLLFLFGIFVVTPVILAHHRDDIRDDDRRHRRHGGEHSVHGHQVIAVLRSYR